MMLGRVLVAEPSVGTYSNALEILRQEGCDIIKPESAQPYLREEMLLRMIKGVDAIITGGDEITSKVLEAADRLKIIAKHGVGVDNIDLEAAAKKNIVIALAPCSNAVADLTFGFIICLARRIIQMNTLVKSGGWGHSPGAEVWGKTLGLVGVGRIGQAVAKRAKGFEMRVLDYDARRDEQLAERLGVEYAPLDRVVQEADFLSLHVTLSEETRGLIGKDQLRLMKPTAYIINTARAEIVDEEALHEALERGRIAGYAVDVYSRVPPPRDSPLLRLDNVITTPWAAAVTYETLREIELTCAENILRVLKGESPLYPLNVSVSS